MLQDIFLGVESMNCYCLFFWGFLVSMSSIFVFGVFEKNEDKANV